MGELVSIIVPVYNAEKYLCKCVDSILAQDYENIEVILIDDGSTDKSPSIIKQYQSIDKRVLAIHKENGGAGSAINAGLDAAKGVYYTFVDNDDWIDGDEVSFLVKKLEENNLDISSCSGMDYFEDSGQSVILNSGPDKIFDDHQAVKDILTDHHFTTEAMMKKLYKSTLFNNLRLLNDRNYQDVYIFFKIINRCTKIGYFNTSKYNYLVHSGSITHSGYQSYSVQQVLAYMDNYDLIKTQYPESLRYLEHYIFSVSAANYMRLIIEGLDKEYVEDMNLYQKNMGHYKPLFKAQKSKLFLFAFFLLFRANKNWCRKLVLKNKDRIASVIHA